MVTNALLERIGKTTPGAHLRDPDSNALVVVVAYDPHTDWVQLSDGRRAPWSVWDRFELVVQ